MININIENLTGHEADRVSALIIAFDKEKDVEWEIKKVKNRYVYKRNSWIIWNDAQNLEEMLCKLIKYFLAVDKESE